MGTLSHSLNLPLPLNVLHTFSHVTKWLCNDYNIISSYNCSNNVAEMSFLISVNGSFCTFETEKCNNYIIFTK